VLDVLRAARTATGHPVPAEMGPRRAGDVVAAYANPELASELLGWRATRTLDEMCADHWRWQQSNPDGYRS
jgi:UDP-glucose 4-epimerase